MTAPKRRRKTPAQPRRTHGRQRQRLIDACISALHIHGPSRTTVEKVVAIAKMSPGIVRFYFDSKAAMLVASLQFLADEFEERVMQPVAALRTTPVAALELLVDLYLAPDIASPRKVAVWYAFWGEASSRQEYYDICGQKDESFAALVRDLIGALIAATSQPQLDRDGVALGLIGVLEILWQEFAFQTESGIDRDVAKRRCMSYLSSVFPGRFLPALPDPRSAVSPAAPAQAHALERDHVFRHAWSVTGHESQIAMPGQFFTVDTGAERVLMVRDSSGLIRAWRNSCPGSPHALVDKRSGTLDAGIECKVHGLRFSLDGRPVPGAAARSETGRGAAAPGATAPGATAPGGSVPVTPTSGAMTAGAAGLVALDVAAVGGLLFARTPFAQASTESMPAPEWRCAGSPRELTLLDPPMEIVVAADWKIVAEQWLDFSTAEHQSAPQTDTREWAFAVDRGGSWSGGRYLALSADAAPRRWRRRFIMPNQLFESRADGVSIVQVFPGGPGRCIVRRLDLTASPQAPAARALMYLAARLGPYARRITLDLAASVQRGVADFGYGPGAGADIPAGVSWFRRRLAAALYYGPESNIEWGSSA